MLIYTIILLIYLKPFLDRIDPLLRESRQLKFYFLLWRAQYALARLQRKSAFILRERFSLRQLSMKLKMIVTVVIWLWLLTILNSNSVVSSDKTGIRYKKTDSKNKKRVGKNPCSLRHDTCPAHQQEKRSPLWLVSLLLPSPRGATWGWIKEEPSVENPATSAVEVPSRHPISPNFSPDSGTTFFVFVLKRAPLGPIRCWCIGFYFVSLFLFPFEYKPICLKLPLDTGFIKPSHPWS